MVNVGRWLARVAIILLGIVVGFLGYNMYGLVAVFLCILIVGILLAALEK